MQGSPAGKSTPSRTPVSSTEVAAGVVRVWLKPRRAEPFFGRHPWVFAGAIARYEADLTVGMQVALCSAEGEFIAYGLANPASNIAVRLYSWAVDRPIDEFLWREKIQRAIALRKMLPGWGEPDSACRLIFSEADALSGLIVDRYDRRLLVQLTSAALAARRELLAKILCEECDPAGLWLRTEKGIREQEGLELTDGLLWGEPPPRPLIVREHDLQYRVDVVEGQKTGFFLDQRDNRLQAARYLRGRNVLDVCCYSGGFAMNAIRHGGALSVQAVDVSAQALQLAGENITANGLADRITLEKGDAFKTLERYREEGRRYGAIVLDPPKLARHQRGLDEALRGYHSLNRMAVDLLEPGGVLITCSCTGHVSGDMFLDMLSDVSRSTGRALQLLEQRGPAADHPVNLLCPESQYLKCMILRAE